MIAIPRPLPLEDDQPPINAEAQDLSWATSREDARIQTPQSTVSGSTFYSADIAPWRWLGLLAGDAIDTEYNSSLTAFVSRAAVNAEAITDFRNTRLTHDSLQTKLNHEHIDQLQSCSSQASVLESPDESGQSALHDPVMLLEHEMTIFRHFVDKLSHRIDLTDPQRHFAITVPQLAMHNKGLMKAILALSSRHLSIQNAGLDFVPDRTLAVQYYNETLNYLQHAMKVDSYLRSDELLATVLIISTYEMIDGAGKGWERHLKGVFWIQRSQDINGESGGLKQAIWWAWLRQDIWAAFRERRKVLSFFTPTKPYYAMDAWDLAARPVYLLGQCINYGSDHEIEAGKRDLKMRIERADELLNMLEEWHQSLSPHFRPLPTSSGDHDEFRKIWINPPEFGKYTWQDFQDVWLLIQGRVSYPDIQLRKNHSSGMPSRCRRYERDVASEALFK